MVIVIVTRVNKNVYTQCEKHGNNIANVRSDPLKIIYHDFMTELRNECEKRQQEPQLITADYDENCRHDLISNI